MVRPSDSTFIKIKVLCQVRFYTPWLSHWKHCVFCAQNIASEGTVGTNNNFDRNSEQTPGFRVLQKVRQAAS